MCETKTPVQPRLLVIGYGNTLRGDDGVGPVVARDVAALNDPRVSALECVLLTPELAEPVSKARQVVFVDATIEVSDEVTLREVVPAASSQLLGHSANPATMLALARDVFGRSPRAWLIAIPVRDLAAGEVLSETAQRGRRTAIKMILDLLEGR